tara:strand:- start:17919 stop:18107 length:189 start_codon:yes stop_codon:yes gene_type:complete
MCDNTKDRPNDWLKATMDGDINYLNYCRNCEKMNDENKDLREALKQRDDWIYKHSPERVIFP